MDKLTKERRSWNMSHIKSKNIKPEIIVRSFLHRNGFRFRLHVKDLPGKPDVVLPKYNAIIQVKGCFWHRHEGCIEASIPKTNSSFWQEKFEKNLARDRKNDILLRNAGWNIYNIWECETEHMEILGPKLIAWLKNCLPKSGLR